ncbi:MAG: RDD family protein [Candidatus Aminicenantes bacterium]|nr:RDD family protein [Candidatus Aminicenantes bacterium]
MNLSKPAGLALRLTAWIFDLILIGIASLKLGRYEVGLVLGPTSIDTNAQAAAVILLVVWMNLVLFHLIEIASGASPAKWILGLKVRRPDGGSVTVWRRIIRCLGNIIPLMFATGLWALQSYMPIWARALLGALLLLGLAPLFGPMKLPLADLVAGTTLTRGKSLAA